MARFPLAEIVVLSVVVLFPSTTSNTAQNVILVSEEPISGDQLDPECSAHLCSSVECIVDNVTDFTLIQFVSQEFEMRGLLSIEDQKGIQIVGSSSNGNKTTIVCPEQSKEYQETVGISFKNVMTVTISNIAVKNCGYSERKNEHDFRSAIYLFHCTDVTITNISVGRVWAME